MIRVVTIDEQTGAFQKPIKEEEPANDEFLCKFLWVEDDQVAQVSKLWLCDILGQGSATRSSGAACGSLIPLMRLNF